MGSSLGGGAVIAVAALLWLGYLTPAWVRRRHYVRTERTATRLQQTLRVLAETSELPDEVRAEVSARSVADQHRALREAARGAERVARPRAAAAERALVRSGRGPREPRRRADAVSAIATARLRRSRVLATNVLVVGLTVGGWGVTDLSASGSWDFLAAGAVFTFVAVALLHRAATVAAANRAVEAVDRTVSVQHDPVAFTDWQRGELERPTWTPVPIPRPLYLDRDEQEATAPATEVVSASLREAARRADEALRAAHAAPEIALLDPVAREEVLGQVHETGPVLHDLDGVLRRRRTA